MSDKSITRKKNRKIISDGALDLFISKGIAQTTIEDIATATGFQRKTFYTYFKDKNDIATYVYFEAMKEFYGDGFKEENYYGYTTGYEKTEKYFDIMLSKVREKPEVIQYFAYYSFYMKSGPIKDEIHRIYMDSEVYEPFNFIEEGMKDGSIRITEHDPRRYFSFIHQIYGSFTERFLYRHYDREKDNIEEILEDISELVVILLSLLKK